MVIPQSNPTPIGVRTETTNAQGQVTGVTYSYEDPAIHQAKLEQQKKEREALLKAQADQREADRIRRNTLWETNPPREYMEVSPGGRGYHFNRNFKASDGNWYAEYQSNRGNRIKLYSLSEREYQEGKHISDRRCNSCGQRYPAVIPGDSVCPNCKATNRIMY